MPRKPLTAAPSGRTILLVDDDPAYLEATRLLLKREGHEVICVTNGQEALDVLHQQPVDLLLLDYYMPGMTGEEVVTRLRQFNPYVQVVLQTGYASEQPSRELLRRLDIQGYYDKSEGPEKLLLWTDVGLKVAYTVQLLYKSRQGLRYILDVTPDLHKIQPLGDLLQGILWQVAGLLGAANSFLAVLPEGGVIHTAPIDMESFLAVIGEDTELHIYASTGRFMGETQIDRCLEPQKFTWICETLNQGEVRVVDTATIVPLRVGDLTIGVIYLDCPAILAQDIELLHIFANQAAVAIQNAQLYEMATLDHLTGVYSRRFFEQWLVRELRTAFRSRQPTVLLMMDLDGMKRINDTAGHLAGDQALAAFGKVLRQATRNTDIVGRYGGDEFAIILPQSRPDGAERVGQRIFDCLQDKSVDGPNGPIPLGCSIGFSLLEAHTFPSTDLPRPIPPTYFQFVGQTLIQQADEALYQAKRGGGNRFRRGSDTSWPTFAAFLKEEP